MARSSRDDASEEEDDASEDCEELESRAERRSVDTCGAFFSKYQQLSKTHLPLCAATRPRPTRFRFEARLFFWPLLAF